jgi:hypothetical protein
MKNPEKIRYVKPEFKLKIHLDPVEDILAQLHIPRGGATSLVLI